MTDVDPAPVTGVALVRTPVAPLHAEPRVSSPQTSQALFGRAVWLADRAGDWRRARTTPDGYEGWVHAGYLAVIDDPALARALAHAPPGARPDLLTADATMHVSLGCTARAGGRTLRLPVGAWVGGGATVLAGEAVPMGELPERFPRDGAAALRTARRYFESTSYQWGGVTPWGADCSGMVQAVYALHGVDLPRDAWQQAGAGVDAGPDLAAHAPGDLLFFSDRDDRRVTHVGVAAGGGTMCHLALGRGGWAVDDLADDADPYTARLRPQLVAARRVVG
jgi:cell wall-associated NlpC family hydrolase